MNTVEILKQILAELTTLKGQPLTWDNYRWFEFYVNSVDEVASPSPMKDALMSKWGEELWDYKEILMRRSERECDEIREKAGDLRFLPILDEDHDWSEGEPTKWCLCRL